jgi:NDP-sugar pyrophosphorylase family protein
MILAAGLGTRLRPFTERMPKILVPVLGVPMLDRLRVYLGRNGAGALALNTHHLPEAVRAHLAADDAASTRDLLPVALFHEPALLGTGGALVNAAPFWGAVPLLVWNGDILADVPPRTLLQAHTEGGGRAPLATLAVQSRPTDSCLLVDAEGNLCGLDSPRRGRRQVFGAPPEPLRALAFNGISILTPELRAHMPLGGAFDLLDVLLDAVAAGGRVRAWDAGDAFYGSTGTPAQLAALEAALASRPDVLGAWTP